MCARPLADVAGSNGHFLRDDSTDELRLRALGLRFARPRVTVELAAPDELAALLVAAGVTGLTWGPVGHKLGVDNTGVGS